MERKRKEKLVLKDKFSINLINQILESQRIFNTFIGQSKEDLISILGIPTEHSRNKYFESLFYTPVLSYTIIDSLVYGIQIEFALIESKFDYKDLVINEEDIKNSSEEVNEYHNNRLKTISLKQGVNLLFIDDCLTELRVVEV